MIRYSLAALCLASMVGCSANSSFQPFAGNTDSEHAQLAAYAASNKYPTDVKASNDMRIGAITNPADGKVKLLNFTDQPVRDARVWVNGLYVNHIDLIPAHGSVSIKHADFFDATGHDMASLKAFPTKVEIESGDKLYSVMSASLE